MATMRALKAALPSGGEMAFATTTATNLRWKVGDLIDHISEEHSLFRGMPRKA